MEVDADERGDLQPIWRSRVHPDDLAAALKSVELCLSLKAGWTICEYRLRSRDDTRWQWMRTDISVGIRDANGRVTRLIGAMSNITEAKAVEQALCRSIEQIRSAFENAIGKAIVGLDGTFLRVNPALCALLGYPEEQLLQTDFQTLTHPDDLIDDLTNLAFLRGGQIPSYQLKKTLHPGERIGHVGAI